ncbi:CaiB/BaiF CoA transferase family protein [Mycobacterium sp. NPDC003449]
MTIGQGPLAGVEIVDMSTTFMGPLSTAMLAQWGAKVIKVEAPGGDILRYVGDVKEIGLGPVFLNANRGKRSIVLDLKNEKGMRALEGLVERADVFVHNLRPKTARKLDITPERMLGINERLILCAYRGYAAGGPYAERAAYDDVIQAASGLAAVQGNGADPAYVKSALADKTMGLFGAAAILAALYGRQETGLGRAIEVPMFESMTAFTLLEQQGGLVYDPQHGQSGYARTASPQRRPCRTKDGHLAVMLYTDDQWSSFFEAIGRPVIAAHPRYPTKREPTKHSDEQNGRAAGRERVFCGKG